MFRQEFVLKLGKLLLTPTTRHAESEVLDCSRRQRALHQGESISCVGANLQSEAACRLNWVPGVTRGKRRRHPTSDLERHADQRKVEQKRPKSVMGDARRPISGVIKNRQGTLKAW